MQDLVANMTESNANWNPWHGCHKLSEGCLNCYVHRMDARHGLSADDVYKTKDFYLPIRHARGGGYKLPSGTLIATCFTSDFLLDAADAWREESWRMMRERADCTFFFITKRIDRLAACLPRDWGEEGYPNVRIGCTMENQARADERLPIFHNAAIQYKHIICEPLLGPIDLRAHLGPWANGVTVGGESGDAARPCDYDWVLDIRDQCIAAGVPFYFKQTGYRFIKDGKPYLIRRSLQHAQAREAGINTQ